MLSNLKQSGWVHFALIHIVAIGAPVCLIVGGGDLGLSLQSLLQTVVSLAFAFTSALILTEALMSIRRRRAPGVQGQVRRSSRILTVILVAYLPNEQDVIIDSAMAVLRDLDWPVDHLQLIVAYNTPNDLPVEADLHELAADHEAIEVLRVEGSTSKAENLIAAIEHSRGHVTAIIDSDHRLHDQSANRAMRWFDEGYDVVQGRCVVRNPNDSVVSKLVSIEFEQIYGLAHAGRSLLMDTAIFGGANGWWRTAVLRQLGFDKSMLTEDIDVSMRAMLSGYRIIHDRSVMSTELAPTDWGGWWKQRTRWAQGWFQVTMRHQGAVMRSPILSIPLKAYWSVLLTWRELFPLIAIQVMTLILADIALTGTVDVQFDPLAGLSMLLTLASGLIAAWGTWRLSTPETQAAHGRLRYALFGFIAAPYTMLRNTVALVALAREALGDHRWVVTARKPATAGAGATASIAAAVVAGALALGGAQPTTASAAVADTTDPVLTAEPAPAQTPESSRSLGLVEPGDQPITLNTTQPVATFNLATPGMWESITGTLTLKLSGAAQLSAKSRMWVTINGQQVAAGIVEPGTKSIDVPLPKIPVQNHSLFVQVHTQLRTTLENCPPPNDPTATAQLLEGTRILAVPTTKKRATLHDLPAALVDARDDDPAKVTVRFKQRPTGEAIAAAGVAVGAIAAERGYPGVQVKVVGRKKRATIVIDDREGPARLHVTTKDGHATLTIAGDGRDLAPAALMLTNDQLKHERGRMLSDAHGKPAPRDAYPDVIALDGATQSAPGTSTAQVGFNIPGRYEVQRGAHLRFTGSVESPGVTRSSVTINGRRLLSKTDDATALPLKIDTLLADRGPSYMLGDLRPGDNAIAVKAVTVGAPQLCVTQTAITSTIDPAGTIELTAKPRPLDDMSLATWPFPMDRLANWASSDVIIPADPTRNEIASVVSVLAEAQRVTGEPALPSIRLGDPTTPTAATLILARPGRVPADLTRKVEGGTGSGTLTVLKAGNEQGVVLAVGSRALIPLVRAYSPERLNAVTVDIDEAGEVTSRTPFTKVATATPPGHTEIRLPLLVLGGSILVMFAVSLRTSLRRNRRAGEAARAEGHPSAA